jgi:hypothetical protein
MLNTLERIPRHPSFEGWAPLTANDAAVRSSAIVRAWVPENKRGLTFTKAAYFEADKSEPPQLSIGPQTFSDHARR